MEKLNVKPTKIKLAACFEHFFIYEVALIIISILQKGRKNLSNTFNKI